MYEHLHNKMKLQIDHSSPLPLHIQVEQLLRKLIETPRYQQGDFLPKEVELANRLGVSRNTVRQATNKLKYEGLIVRKKGYGTKVRERNVTTRLDNWHSFTEEMNAQGIAFTNYRIDTSWTEAGRKLGNFFAIDPQVQVLKLERLRGDEDGPFVYFVSYFHPRIGLTGHEDFSAPLYDILERDYHVVPALSRERISAQSAKKTVANTLGIGYGSPVLVRERFVYDPGNRPIEYNIGHYVADKFTYTIDIKR
jgi:GntR family transcriptional regulator